VGLDWVAGAGWDWVAAADLDWEAVEGVEGERGMRNHKPSARCTLGLW